MIKSEARRILDIVADLSQNDVKKDVLETEIISHSGLSALEVRNYLNELEWMNLVKEAMPRPSHAEYRLWNVTDKGLQDRSRQNHS
jgi:predicted transcriptional regulator